jgi:predicted kinase
MQGLPGSGKSTVAKELGGVIVSADEFFMKDGEYKFNPKLAGLAHNWCFENFCKHVDAGAPVVVVDNTNTVKSEWKRYAEYGEEHGYRVEFITMPTISAEESFERNTHGVPLEVCQLMWENLYG